MEHANNPNVSIIIPTFNRADCITRTIDSVLDQTYKDFEVIVVDDGSTDNTREVCKPYSDTIRYIFRDNAGCAAARNTGIHSSRGKWIAFIDSDDMWHPKYLEYQMQCLEILSTKVTVSNLYQDFEGKETYFDQSVELPLTTNDIQLIEDPLEITLSRNELTVTLQGMIVERELIEHLGCFDERVLWASDRRFILRLATETPFAYIKRELVILDRVPGRQRITNDLKKLTDEINGDIAGIGKNLMIVSPSDVKIDRHKLRGKY